MSDYKVTVKVQNNNILRIIQSQGYVSLLQFSKATGFSYGPLNELINLKKAPLATNGELRPSVYKLCEILDCLPEELFSASQMEAALETNKRTFEMNEAEARFMLNQAENVKSLEDLRLIDERDRTIEDTLDTLTSREKKVIEMRFGLNGHDSFTLKGVSEHFGVHTERIRQIEAKALRKLRHPIRSEPLRDFVE